MRFGPRRISLKKSFKARTTGRLKRAVKSAIIPFYGKRGMGLLHPKRALYNRVYQRTTFSVPKLLLGAAKGSSGRRNGKSAVAKIASSDEAGNYNDYDYYDRLVKSLPEEKASSITESFELAAKSTQTAYIIWLFLGVIGGHRFYVQDYFQTILMLIVGAASWKVGIAWMLVDGFFLKKRVDGYNAKVLRGILNDIIRDRATTYLNRGTTNMATEALPDDVGCQYPADDTGFTLNEQEKTFCEALYQEYLQLGLPDITRWQREKNGEVALFYGIELIAVIRLQKRKHYLHIYTGAHSEPTVINGELGDFLPNVPVLVANMAQKQISRC